MAGLTFISQNSLRISPLTQSRPASPSPFPEQKLTQYAGLYWKADEDRALRVLSKDGKLFVAPASDEQLELTPLSENRFKLTVAPVTVVFEDAASRASPRMRVQEGIGSPELFERVVEFKPRPDQLAAFTGSYRSEEIDPVYRIMLESGGLVLKRLKSKPEKLEPTLEDHFMGLHGDVHFQRDPAGQITGFVLNAGRVTNFRLRSRAGQSHNRAEAVADRGPCPKADQGGSAGDRGAIEGVRPTQKPKLPRFSFSAKGLHRVDSRSTGGRH